MRLQRYLAAAGVAARRKAEELIVDGPRHGQRQGRDRARHQGRSRAATRSPSTARRSSRSTRSTCCSTSRRLHHRGHRRSRPPDGDGLPAEPAGAGEAGRPARLLQRGRAAADQRRRARRAAARAGEPRAEDVSREGARPGRRERPQARCARGVRARRRHDDAAGRGRAAAGESKHTWLAITIYEGKQRQIHRMLEALGYRVDKLQRVAFANLTFHDLRVGDARELTQQELNELRDAVGLDRARGRARPWHARARGHRHPAARAREGARGARGVRGRARPGARSRRRARRGRSARRGHRRGRRGRRGRSAATARRSRTGRRRLVVATVAAAVGRGRS